MKLYLRLIFYFILLIRNFVLNASYDDHLDNMMLKYQFTDTDFNPVSKKSYKPLFHSTNDSLFIQGTKIMSEIINEYQKNSFVDQEKQQLFKSKLIDLQQYVDHLDPQKNNIKAYRQNFLNPYKSWAKFILKKPTAEQIEQQKKEQEEKQAADDAKLFFKKISDQIESKLDRFANKVHKMLEGLEGYNKQHSDEFYEGLSGAIKTFETQMMSIQKNTLADFYSQERSRGRTVEPRNLTEYQRAVSKGIQDMTGQALTRARALVLDLTAQARTQDFTNQMLDVLQKHKDNEPYQEAAFNKILQKNEDNFVEQDWQEVKQAGSEIVSNFIENTKQELKKESVSFASRLVKEHTGFDIGKLISI